MLFYTDMIRELISELRDHKQHHVYGLPECECDRADEYLRHLPCDGYVSVRGEFNVDADGSKVPVYQPCDFDHDDPPKNLGEQRDYIIRLLQLEIEGVKRLADHTCKHETDDTDSYYLRCPICGSDGNA